MMQSAEYSPVPHHSDASRPSLGFPLGTGVLLIVIFSLSGIFSCCYHWDKFRSLRHSFSHDIEAALHPTHISKPPLLPDGEKHKQREESVGVIMPGDEVAKFIAMPCPCQPVRPHHLAPAVVPPCQKPP
uniref:Hydroxyproline-rich glycoprotein family protein n=1 Tax=Opuntia streptacantha TaxID=393608 RepID=A0A7C8YHV1_OPUST